MNDDAVERSREAVLHSLRGKAAGVKLADKARELGASYDEVSGELKLTMLGRAFIVGRDLRVRSAEGEASYQDQVVLLNALSQPGGQPLPGWAPFRELAAGHSHDFRDEAETPLAEAADEICAAGERVATALGARVVEPVGGCDLCLEVALFPGVTALVQVYREDMEFPADAKILFSRGAERFLPPGCLEELGRQLADRVRRAAGVN